jgi:hypothetical protein
MSDDPLIRQLSKFTPNGGGLDRDDLLFAAGKASAKPSRRWQALASMLAMSQTLTLVLLLWPANVPLAPETGQPTFVAVEPPMPPETKNDDLRKYWQLREQLLSGDGALPPLEHYDSALPDEPPLRVFDLFN